MKIEDYLKLSEADQQAYLLTISDSEREQFLTGIKEYQDYTAWVDKINSDAAEYAVELSALFGQEVQPTVFVIEPMKDFAAAFVRLPDLDNSLKIMRMLQQPDTDAAYKMLAQSQLIREADLAGKGQTGIASDSRFLDAVGKCDPAYTTLNLSLIWKMKGLIQIYTDQFKKK